MNVYTELDGYEPDDVPLAIAIGNFDGVHRGHQAIFEIVRNRALAIGGRSAVLTFREHPQHVLSTGQRPRLLTSWTQKLSLLERTGLDLCFMLHFTEMFSKQTAQEFVENILMRRLRAKSVCTGYNAKFGRGRLGDADLMRELSLKFGFEFYEAAPFEVDGRPVSSTLVRSCITSGDLETVRGLLGRFYSITAPVVKGLGRGKTLGFPTANMSPGSEALPPPGVYAVIADWLKDETDYGKRSGFMFRERIARDNMFGVLNYGFRPTFASRHDARAVMEVHFLDFDEHLLGETLEIKFVKKLREEKKFSDEKALTDQIQEDVREARKILTQVRANEARYKYS